MHWITQALRMNVDEGILVNELLTGMKSAPKVAANIVARMPPQVLASPGQPALPAWGFPGAPSGVRIALQRLDAHYKRDITDEELDSLERFHKTERTGKMRAYLSDFEYNLEEANVRANLWMNLSSLSWHLI